MDELKEKNYQELWNKKRLFKIERDRLKPKLFIYSSFVVTNQQGFSENNIRSYLFADVVNRYYRMNGYNVMNGFGYNDLAYSAFCEARKNNRSKDVVISKYHDQIMKLGLGVDSDKELNMNNLDFILFIQKFFIELYQKNLIEYKYSPIHVSTIRNKILNEFEIEIRGCQKVSRFFNEPVREDYQDIVVLKVDKYVQNVAKTIQKLKLSVDSRNMLLNALKPFRGLLMSFHSDSGVDLTVTVKNPEFLAGIGFICLNPKYIDVFQYVSSDEEESVIDYINSSDTKGVFSGIIVKNPLTYEDIPVIISSQYETDIHIGIPSYNERDLLFCETFSLEYNSIIDGDILINSDFLSGMTFEMAKEQIINAFVKEDMASIVEGFSLEEVIISSLDAFGALIPLMDTGGKLSLVNGRVLPIYLNSKLQLTLNSAIDTEEIQLINLSFNSLFTSGLSSIALRLYEKKIGILDPFQEEGYSFLTNWAKAKVSFVKQEEIFKEILMPLFIFEILKDIKQQALSDPFDHIFVENVVYDEFGVSNLDENFKADSLDTVIEKYGADVVRCYLVSAAKLEDSLYYDGQMLCVISEKLAAIKRIFKKDFPKECYELDYPIHELVSNCNKCIKKYDINQYTKNLLDFYDDYLVKRVLSKNQALIYLKLLSIVIPHLCEDIFMNIFENTHFILFEEWPM